MPNPKIGTVTDDIEKAVSDSKSGKVEYRTDRQAIVHMAIGKAGFDQDKLLDNFTAVIDEIMRAKPASAKGRYVISCTLATSMGPGIRVDTHKAADRELVGAAAGETAAEPANA
jgi:large subunit ribosomal protein L1